MYVVVTVVFHNITCDLSCTIHVYTMHTWIIH